MATELMAELRSLGVLLSIGADGSLAYDAPAGVMTDSLIARMRAEREGLLAAVEREDAERPAWNELKVAEASGPEYLAPMRGVCCPWCTSGEHLLELPEGLLCDNCGREAFRFEGGSIVRADWVDLRLVDWPVRQMEQCVEPEKKRPTRIERGVRALVGSMFET